MKTDELLTRLSRNGERKLQVSTSEMRKQGPDRVVQVQDACLTKHEALSSNPSTTKKKYTEMRKRQYHKFYR
jgi:hypothetical protein